MDDGDWEGGKAIGMYLNGDGIAGKDARGGTITDDHFLLYFNADGPAQVTLPTEEYAAAWDVVIDTGGDADDRPDVRGRGHVRPGRPTASSCSASTPSRRPARPLGRGIARGQDGYGDHVTDPAQPARRTPHSTYRLQVSPDFTLFDAAGVLPYLHDLGVDWVYLSPLLASEPGSTHGYDVVAFDHVDPERGGEEGLAALSAEARRLGMGVLVDIVPNHVGVATPSEDPWWWDVLKLGRESEHANAFDVDWAAGDGRIVIPVLGDDDEDATRSRSGEVRYHDQRFPLAPGTTTLEEQHYELVNWRAADEGLNYRRFFAVNTLAAVRVEDPEVFAETHAEIKRWFDEGLVDGLRVDHPDGLRDPRRYLDDLADLTGGAYVLVEKILEPGEELSPSGRPPAPRATTRSRWSTACSPTPPVRRP